MQYRYNVFVVRTLCILALLTHGRQQMAPKAAHTRTIFPLANQKRTTILRSPKTLEFPPAVGFSRVSHEHPGAAPDRCGLPAGPPRGGAPAPPRPLHLATPSTRRQTPWTLDASEVVLFFRRSWAVFDASSALFRMSLRIFFSGS